MARIAVSVLNIRVHPHPPGAYRDLALALAKVRKEAPYRGARVAKVGSVNTKRSDQFVTGYVNTYEKIDVSEPWFDEKAQRRG